MKKILCFMFLFFFGIIPTYALSFNVKATVDKDSINAGDKVKLSFELIDIKDATVGISSCEMNVSLSDGITLASDYALADSNWKFEKGNEKIMLILMNDYLKDTKLFSVSLKVNKTGFVEFTHIKCFELADEGVENSYDIESRKVNIAVKSAASSKPSTPDVSSEEPLPSSMVIEKVYLKGFETNVGTIEVTEDRYDYTVNVKTLDDIQINPVLGDGMTYTSSEYLVEDGYGYEFTVTDKDGESKNYKVIFMLDSNASPSSSAVITADGGQTDYTIYFVAIIVVLVLINFINFIRIFKKGKKDSE